MMKMLNALLFFLILLACDSDDSSKQDAIKHADVTKVEVSGSQEVYTFTVTISSPDTGCDQYADWWEVLTEDGDTLIYRRILAHSHVDEQPFPRSGGTVGIAPDEFIYVRAHMNNLGYDTQVFSGNVREGLTLDSLSTDYAASLAMQEPLPTDCAF